MMTSRRVARSVWAVGLVVGLIGWAGCADDRRAIPRPNRPPPMARVEASPAEIEALIDDLQTVGEPGIGYETTSTASDFLPLPGAMNWHAGLLYQIRPPVRSDVLAKLVACGAPAVTHLVAHLDDARPASVTIEGPGWRYLGDEYDVNIRTDLPPGEGLNDWPSNLPAPDETITVGDLCFVALGQIVNRQFNAVRYQPTMNIIINSPRQSPPLLAAARRQWTGLTPETHRASLIADFRQPDDSFRRAGAYLRLAYYYPEEVEELVLAFLAEPTYDPITIYDFLTGALYRTDDADERRRLYDAFLSARGAVAADGIKVMLFEHLDNVEATEQGRMSPPITEYANQPRELLAQLFGYDDTITSDQKPFVDGASRWELSALLEVL
ncbi:MAG: hypothetical protein ACYTFO_06875, partial [Planctomycetota bacterium]